MTAVVCCKKQWFQLEKIIKFFCMSLMMNVKDLRALNWAFKWGRAVFSISGGELQACISYSLGSK